MKVKLKFTSMSIAPLLVHAPGSAFYKPCLHFGAVSFQKSKITGSVARASRSCGLIITSLFAACAVLVSAAGAIEAPQQQLQEESETLSNIPQTLSGECASPKDCKKARIQRPKSRKAESCTSKCVGTCIRGGDGSPGEGPFNIRRPLVVFKQGFRSRQYWYFAVSSIHIPTLFLSLVWIRVHNIKP